MLVADNLGIRPEDILEYELCLYPLEPAATASKNDNEYFQSARIDDLSMAYAGLEALLNTADTATGYTRIVAVFDNEETGSGTKQGAASPVLGRDDATHHGFIRRRTAGTVFPRRSQQFHDICRRRARLASQLQRKV